ncbi:hypothetical protein, partial [Paracoccus aminovorans]|uniref:hypothetical protein n=1 Tax=Paracoccus aminovorans TaxID=34004 RepID=UPI0039EC52B6
GLHRRPEIAELLAEAYETLQFKANKTANSEPKINVVEVVQIGLFSVLQGLPQKAGSKAGHIVTTCNCYECYVATVSLFCWPSL